MGLFDKLFDLNGDGKSTLDEELFALGMLGGLAEEGEEDDDVYAWRTWCEDGTEYGVFPEDYETEDEYDDALEDARNSDM